MGWLYYVGIRNKLFQEGSVNRFSLIVREFFKNVQMFPILNKEYALESTETFFLQYIESL